MKTHFFPSTLQKTALATPPPPVAQPTPDEKMKDYNKSITSFNDLVSEIDFHELVNGHGKFSASLKDVLPVGESQAIVDGLKESGDHFIRSAGLDLGFPFLPDDVMRKAIFGLADAFSKNVSSSIANEEIKKHISGIVKQSPQEEEKKQPETTQFSLSDISDSNFVDMNSFDQDKIPEGVKKETADLMRLGGIKSTIYETKDSFVTRLFFDSKKKSISQDDVDHLLASGKNASLVNLKAVDVLTVAYSKATLEQSKNMNSKFLIDTSSLNSKSAFKTASEQLNSFINDLSSKNRSVTSVKIGDVASLNPGLNKYLSGLKIGRYTISFYWRQNLNKTLDKFIEEFKAAMDEFRNNSSKPTAPPASSTPTAASSAPATTATPTATPQQEGTQAFSIKRIIQTGAEKGAGTLSEAQVKQIVSLFVDVDFSPVLSKIFSDAGIDEKAWMDSYRKSQTNIVAGSQAELKKQMDMVSKYKPYQLNINDVHRRFSKFVEEIEKAKGTLEVLIAAYENNPQDAKIIQAIKSHVEAWFHVEVVGDQIGTGSTPAPATGTSSTSTSEPPPATPPSTKAFSIKRMNKVAQNAETPIVLKRLPTPDFSK